ncbi:alpha-L-rhamnosidase C-terminal domain-containing protein [Synoicihabitans lomoniglobus]|uniref:Alpha-L-rhamnosidase C-terminal domain-containing protein n=1 Tax=Synoicihabitans lomoniglobus TaxID=2909285 RepID=A0AAF0I7S6_9BACT|nr:hypothetical protein [Opitutaceae bacterium LMO-M01]WED66976.1 alpha-L-rhamnosidase C-terminal domain-containing protein [Opitutaceae bacterium LMO-M01]
MSDSRSAPLPFKQGASWIWSAEGTHAESPVGAESPSHYKVRRFRREWELADAADAHGVIHVSADSRYVLYCNGAFVGRGPAKGDIHHHFYDSYDIGPFLRTGRNVIAALVWDMSSVAHRPTALGAPCSVMTYAGGFLLQGTVAGAGADEVLDTGRGGWRVAIDQAYRFQNDGTRFEGYHGYFEERVDTELPQGWLDAGFDASAWADATTLYPAERREERRDPASPYGLVPRLIPPLEEGAPVTFADAFLPGGGALSADWAKLLDNSSTGAPATATLPAHSEIEVIFDTGTITTGYPLLRAAEGAGATVRLTYAEALRLPWDTPEAELLGEQQPLENLASHFADEGTGWTFDRRGRISGWSDVWRPAGDADATYEPLHWRAFRYVSLHLKTGAQPLTLRAVSYRYSAYPYEEKADFACADASWSKIWDAGLRTMRLCSHETFEDCPHYEQMQYAGDTMITSHLGMLTSGDYRLSRQALLQFDWSRGPEGLTQSRFPSRLLQVIPSWSLHWITAVRDFGLCSGDLDTVKEVLPGMQGVLDWFRRHRDVSGLPAKLPYWNITDWCPWWPRGVVPGADSDPTCIIASQWILALDEVAQMCDWLGRDAEAATLREEAAVARQQLHELFWSETEGLYFDRPGGPEVSLYGNAWAVVCGAANDATCERLKQRFPHDEKLAPGSFFAWHTVFTAMVRMGTYDEMPNLLGPWHESIALGLDTFVEENSYWRSLCHAWSAHPVLEFLNRVLGVRPTSPGFATIRVQPHPCGLPWAKGRVCTPRGMVRVDWRRAGDEWRISIDSPPDTPVEIVLPDGSVHESPGGAWSWGANA